MNASEQYRINQQNLLTRSDIAHFEGSYFLHEPDKIISIIHDCFDRIIEPGGVPEYMNNFGRYISAAPDEFHGAIEEFLRNAYDITYKSLDASRTIAEIELSLPPLLSRIPVPRLLWQADLRILNRVNLGDGPVMYSETDKRWRFNQRVGAHEYISSLKTRQKA